MIKTDEEIIFEPGEHVINLAFVFERSQYSWDYKKEDSNVDLFYTRNCLKKTENKYLSSQAIIIPEGYEMFQINTEIINERRIQSIVTLVNTQRVSISTSFDIRLPGKPLDTMSRKLKNTNLDK